MTCTIQRTQMTFNSPYIHRAQSTGSLVLDDLGSHVHWRSRQRVHGSRSVGSRGPWFVRRSCFRHGAVSLDDHLGSSEVHKFDGRVRAQQDVYRISIEEMGKN